MALTDIEKVRIEAIEELLNELQIAVKFNLASRQFVEQMLLLKQNELDALKNRVTELESQVTALQGQL
jgi:polyhydroxyalkanoate synthesis regulator phasin